MELDPVPLNLARDLPCEVLFQIASFLSAKDMLNLATTCKKIAAVINSDEAWETRVLDWISEQDVRADILGTSAEEMMNILGLHTQRSTYQALIALKTWPCGLWYNADSSADSTFQPRGKLVLIPNHMPHRSFRGNIGHTCIFLGWAIIHVDSRFPWPPIFGGSVMWEVDEDFHERFAPWFIQVHCKKGVFCSEVARVDLATSNTTFPDMKFKANSEDKTQFQIIWNPFDDAGSLALKPDGCWTFKRAGVMHDQQQTSPPAPPPGLYYAFYGFHGLEILQLERIEGTRYNAVKLIGDPNVPATQISFQFDSSTDNIRSGPYNSQRDDPFPDASGPRPVVTYVGQSILPAHMEERPVGAVVSNAQGQINRDPDVWSPEMVQATVVVYDYDLVASNTVRDVDIDGATKAVFSVIFEDQGEPCRHVMDFFCCPIPRVSSSYEDGSRSI